MLSKKCIVCGKEFIKPKNESLKNWENRHKFCSINCRDNSLIGKKNNSKTKFKKGQTPWNKGLKGYKAGSLNNKWKGGITSENEKFRKSNIYIIWRKIIWMRDKFTCQECGKVGGRLHVHHIKSFSKYPKLRLYIENGKTLCIPCHKKMHPNLNFINTVGVKPAGSSKLA